MFSKIYRNRSWVEVASHWEKLILLDVCCHDIFIWMRVLKNHHHLFENKILRNCSRHGVTALTGIMASYTSTHNPEHPFLKLPCILQIFISTTFPLKRSSQLADLICTTNWAIFAVTGCTMLNPIACWISLCKTTASSMPCLVGTNCWLEGWCIDYEVFGASQHAIASDKPLSVIMSLCCNCSSVEVLECLKPRLTNRSVFLIKLFFFFVNTFLIWFFFVMDWGSYGKYWGSFSSSKSELRSFRMWLRSVLRGTMTPHEIYVVGYVRLSEQYDGCAVNATVILMSQVFPLCWFSMNYVVPW